MDGAPIKTLVKGYGIAYRIRSDIESLDARKSERAT